MFANLASFWKNPLLAAALALAACSSEQATQVQSRPGVDLGRYRTYNFLDAVARNDSAFQGTGSSVFDVKRAVAHELEVRGLRRADQPDLWVNLGLSTQQRVQTREANFLTDAPPAYLGQRRYHWQAGDVPVRSYEEGTVTIDLVDAARKELVWQGTTTAILSRRPTRAAKQINDGVAEVFERFPAGR